MGLTKQVPTSHLTLRYPNILMYFKNHRKLKEEDVNA